MHRFFVPGDCISQDSVVIDGRLVNRLRSVLRLGARDHVIVLDNTGWEYEVELGAARSGRVEGRIVAGSVSTAEPRTRITLYQALLKGSSFEVVLQKCTEIGVRAFVPVICERCVADAPTEGRAARWQAIILEAAQQSRRGRLPELHPSIAFRDACRSSEGVALLPWEQEGAQAIGAALHTLARPQPPSHVSIFIGPEGGFSPPEAEFARSEGILPVSLGSRILRAETAGLVASSFVLYEFDDLGVRG
jgi:16S rRNA (uracil1498-N3)-methyltransferase